jgi:hypothetical protein
LVIDRLDWKKSKQRFVFSLFSKHLKQLKNFPSIRVPQQGPIKWYKVAFPKKVQFFTQNCQGPMLSSPFFAIFARVS